MDTAAGDWLETSRDESFLLRGIRLDQFASWATEARVALTQWDSLGRRESFVAHGGVTLRVNNNDLADSAPLSLTISPDTACLS